MAQKIVVLFQNSCENFKICNKLKSLIKRAVLGTIESFACKNLQMVRAIEISINFVEDDEMGRLNSTYRNVDKATDVLSFPLVDDFENIVGDYISLGDIVISMPIATKQAHELGHSVKREVVFLAIHGTLHLLGFDHEKSEQDDEEMQAMQEKILQDFEID